MSQGTEIKGLRMVYRRYEGKLSVAEKEDAGEVKKWSGLSESEMDHSWKKLAGRMEEEVLDKYKVEESKKEAF